MTPSLSDRLTRAKAICRKMIETTMVDIGYEQLANMAQQSADAYSRARTHMGAADRYGNLPLHFAIEQEVHEISARGFRAMAATFASSRLSNPAAFKCVLEDIEAWEEIINTTDAYRVAYEIAEFRLRRICETMEALERV